MNVILIISDSMRRDCLGCYGAPSWASDFSTNIGRIHTPHLDRFSERALIFDNAFVASFPTVPARNDILTGRYTWTYKPWSPLDEDEITLQEVLSEAGVLTGLVADTPHPFAPGYNYQRGFHSWELIRGQENDRWRVAPAEIRWPAAAHKLRNPDQTVRQYLRNMSDRRYEEDFFPARTFREAARWLERNYQREPFFLYVDTFDPHEPWDPPRYYTDLYDPDYEGEKVIYPRYDYCDYLTDAELNHCRALYAGEVTMVDHWFGFFIDRVESLGLLDNTAVIFLSDHGFYLGEHGYIGKVILRQDMRQSIPLYPEVARIPMLVHVPQNLHSTGAKRIDHFVQTVDLMPTICELLRATTPPSVEAPSMAPLLTGHSKPGQDFVICSPTLSHSGLSQPHPSDRASIYSGDWLLVFGAQTTDIQESGPTYMVDSISRRVKTLERTSTRPMLFNLANDPQATHNVIEYHATIAREMHASFVDFLEQKAMAEEHLKYYRHLKQ